MGTYVTDETSVEAYMPSIANAGGFSAATRPTTDQVLDFILKREAELDGVLRSAGYSPPLTATEDTRHAGLHVTQIVVFDAFVAHFEFGDIPAQIQAFRKDWHKFLERILAGELQFSSETPLGAEDPVFYMVRPPTRDDWFTERYGQTDWDE
jgi:hypothetical protein